MCVRFQDLRVEGALALLNYKMPYSKSVILYVFNTYHHQGWGWLRSFLGGEDATRVFLILFIPMFSSHVVGSKVVMEGLNVSSFIETASKTLDA